MVCLDIRYSKKIKKFDDKIDEFRKKIKNSEDFKVKDEVFDTATLMALYKLSSNGYLDALGGAVSAGKEANIYNVGGRNEKTNLQIVESICAILDDKTPSKTLSSYKDLITFVEDRAGHDRRYAIDATKLENKLGWKADEDFDSGIVKTIEWYMRKKKVNIINV